MSKTRIILKSAALCATLLFAAMTLRAQEILTNRTIVEMTGAGLGKTLILQKINSAAGDYDVTAKALIELKKAAVDDEVIAAMLAVFEKTGRQNRNLTPETNPLPVVKPDANKTAAQLLREARTITFVKHSLYPSLSDVENAIFKRQRWNKFNLTITRARDEADLICEINHEFLTHYSFRITDRKTNKVIAASGVTSLGGALSGNIANKIIRRFNEVLANENK